MKAKAKPRSPLKYRPALPRQPGQTLRGGLDHELSELFYGSGVAISLGVAGVVVLVGQFVVPVWVTGALLLAAATVVGLLTIGRAFGRIPRLLKGLAGEAEVASALKRIERLGCYVIHDVPSRREGGANADHVVVSPVGVFVLETKYRSKREGENEQIEFDGERVRIGNRPPDAAPIRQAVAIANELQASLGIDVRPVVVFPGWFVQLKTGWQRDRVLVLNSDYLAKWLASEIASTDTPRINVDRVASAVESFAQIDRATSLLGSRAEWLAARGTRSGSPVR